MAKNPNPGFFIFPFLGLGERDGARRGRGVGVIIFICETLSI